MCAKYLPIHCMQDVNHKLLHLSLQRDRGKVKKINKYSKPVDACAILLKLLHPDVDERQIWEINLAFFISITDKAQRDFEKTKK